MRSAAGLAWCLPPDPSDSLGADTPPVYQIPGYLAGLDDRNKSSQLRNCSNEILCFTPYTLRDRPGASRGSSKKKKRDSMFTPRIEGGYDSAGKRGPPRP